MKTFVTSDATPIRNGETQALDTHISGATAAAETVPEIHFGNYRAIRELGHGGMGAVYLAGRADQEFEQHVAIKVIKRGMDTDEIVRRFRRERQILATLEHPNIARLLDGGATEDGLPYFVMEYIRGVPLLEYCSSHELSIPQRLEVFCRICAAVQYAHRNLVIHRDLKPGNILVTEDGTPKLLDFGLAKLLAPQGEPGAEALTMAQDRLMTPDYASPEQARGEPITTATDVYSLGIILYELLTDRRPYRITSPEPDAVARIILQAEPEKPSSAITREFDGVTTRKTGGRMSPARMRKSLEGDLDNIVMMALRKEPQLRYPSVEAFAEDIRRHLNGMPVLARKPTAGYRAGKFIRRHRASLAVAAVLLLSLIGFAAMMTVQSARLAHERDVAARERDRAARVTSFLTGLFSISNPGEARGNTVTAREILDRGSAQIHNELKNQPDVQAALMDTMGRVYQSLGLYDRAGKLLEQALAIRKNLYGEAHPLVADSINALASLRYDAGDLDASEHLYRQALAIRQNLYGDQNSSVAESLNGLALIEHSKANYGRAEKLYRQVLDIERKLPAGENADVGTAVNNLGLVLHDKGDLAAAEPFYRESLEIDRRRFGELHPNVTRDINNLASLLQDKGEYKKAEPLFRQILETNRKLYGAEHPEVAISINNLGRILQDEGDNSAAEPLFREAVAMNRKLLGEGHPSLTRMQSNLAVLLMETGRGPEAKPILQAVLAHDREDLGSDHVLVLKHLNDLGRILLEEGRDGEAETLLREELATATRIGNEAVRARSLIYVGESLINQGRAVEAEPLIRQGLEQFSRMAEEGAVPKLEAQSILGKCLCRMGSSAEGLPLLKQSYRGLESNPEVTKQLQQNALRRLQECSDR